MRSRRLPIFLRPSPFLLTLCLLAPAARAQQSDDIRKLYRTGQYDQCIAASARVIDQGRDDEDPFIYKMRSELATGKYADAKKTLDTGLARDPSSARIRLI